VVPVALLRLTAALASAAALPALAHHAEGGASLASTWNGDPWVVVPMAAAALLYAAGIARLWRRAGNGRGITRLHAACFTGGWLLVALALVSPLDALGEALFSAHMAQHEILMTLAAPLLVSGRPLEAWTWALPARWRAATANALRAGPLGFMWDTLSTPLAAWIAHAIAIWVWHAPVLFDMALREPAIHALQHLSFLGTALFFWWSILRRGVRRAEGASVGSLFTTMLHSGGLGALLTFAPTAWYLHYAATAPAYGFTALEDQQLGGLIMWGPAGLPYLAAGLAIVGSWLSRPRTAGAPLR
jgi:putative membrane protein